MPYRKHGQRCGQDGKDESVLTGNQINARGVELIICFYKKLLISIFHFFGSSSMYSFLSSCDIDDDFKYFFDNIFACFRQLSAQLVISVFNNR